MRFYDNYYESSQQKYWNQRRRYIIEMMRQQQITPWSIYNQTFLNSTHEDPPPPKSKPIVQLPKIKNSENRKSQPESYASHRRRQSARDSSDIVKAPGHHFSPYLSQFTENREAKVEAEKERQTERLVSIETKQQEISKAMNDYIVLQMIKEQLKREKSELHFLNLLKEQQEEETKNNFQCSKGNKSFLLDRHSFPRFNIEKNLMLVNLNHEEIPGIGAQNQKDLSPDIIKELLRKEISSMISNRMKIMGKSKEINYKF